MQTYDYARAALWDTAIKFYLQSHAMTSPDHLVSIALRIPTVHDFRVIAAPARMKNVRARFPSN